MAAYSRVRRLWAAFVAMVVDERERLSAVEDRGM